MLNQWHSFRLITLEGWGLRRSNFAGLLRIPSPTFVKCLGFLPCSVQNLRNLHFLWMTGIPLGNAPFGCVPSLRLKWKARRSVLGHQSLASLVRDDQFSSPRRETKKKSNVRSLGVFDQYFWTVRYLSTKLHMTTQHLKLDFWTKFRLNPILASKVLRKNPRNFGFWPKFRLRCSSKRDGHKNFVIYFGRRIQN